MRKCGPPPPIECIRQRCCVTDRSWADALPFLFCTALAVSKFGAREWRASRGRPDNPVLPFRCVGRARRSVRTRTGCRVLRHRIRTQLYLQCCCACRRHQGCHLTETETSVRLRFLGSSRTSRCLLVSDHMGCRAQSAMASRKLNAKHLLGVAQSANWPGGRSSETLRVQSSRFGDRSGGSAGIVRRTLARSSPYDAAANCGGLYLARTQR